MEPGGGHGEDAGAGSDVEQRAALPVFLDHFEATAGRLVGAGPEGHPGVDLDHQPIGLRPLLPLPGGADQQPLTDLDRFIPLLPLGQPVLVGDGQTLDSTERRSRNSLVGQLVDDALPERVSVRGSAEIGAQHYLIRARRILGDLKAGRLVSPEPGGRRRLGRSTDLDLD